LKKGAVDVAGRNARDVKEIEGVVIVVRSERDRREEEEVEEEEEYPLKIEDLNTINFKIKILRSNPPPPHATKNSHLLTSPPSSLLFSW